MHRNLIVAGNFNLTNVNELFNTLVELGQHPKEMADTITVMEKIGHFLDDAVAKIYKTLRKEGYSKADASPKIAERLNMKKVLRKASKKWDGGYAIAGMLGGLAAGTWYLVWVRTGGSGFLGITQLTFGIFGSAVSLIAMVVVSLMTAEPDKATQKMVDDVRVPSGKSILGKSH